MLSLNGEVLRLDNMTVSMSMELKDKDMSGQSSGTDTSEQGDKPKVLKFAGLVAFKNSDVLTRLYELASSKDTENNRQKYRIGNDTARNLRIREGKFAGTISATENSSLLAWDVLFELREVNSVAEQTENRLNQQTAIEQTQNTRLEQALINAEESGL